MKRFIKCQGKTQYETKKEILKAIECLKTQDVYLTWYKCPVCGKYHLTEGRR